MAQEQDSVKWGMIKGAVKIGALLVAGIGIASVGGEALMDIAANSDHITRTAAGGLEIGAQAWSIPSFVGTLGVGLASAATGVTAALAWCISTPINLLVDALGGVSTDVGATELTHNQQLVASAGVGAVAGAVAAKATHKCPDEDKQIYGRHTQRLAEERAAAINTERQV